MSDDPLKYLPSPDPRIVRIRAAAQASAGELLKTNCPHPVSAIEQYVDEIGDRERYQRPTNLFECSICHTLLRLVDFHSREAIDG